MEWTAGGNLVHRQCSAAHSRRRLTPLLYMQIHRSPLLFKSCLFFSCLNECRTSKLAEMIIFFTWCECECEKKCMKFFVIQFLYYHLSNIYIVGMIEYCCLSITWRPSSLTTTTTTSTTTHNCYHYYHYYTPVPTTTPPTEDVSLKLSSEH